MEIGIPDSVKSLSKKVTAGTRDRVERTASAAADRAAGAVRETVGKGRELAGDAVDVTVDAGQDFGGGVKMWGTDLVDTATAVGRDPVGASKGVARLGDAVATTSLPGYATVRGGLEGKTAWEQQDEANATLAQVGKNVAGDYQEVYEQHGALGAAGYVAPDLVMAVFSGGTSAGVKTGVTVAAKEGVRAGVSAGAREAAKTGMESASRAATREGALEVGREVVNPVPDVRTVDGAVEAGAHAQELGRSPCQPDQMTNLLTGIANWYCP